MGAFSQNRFRQRETSWEEGVSEMSKSVANYLLGLRQAMTGKGAKMAGTGRSLGDIDLSIHREVVSRKRPVMVQRWQTRSGDPMSRMVSSEPVPYRKVSAFPTA